MTVTDTWVPIAESFAQRLVLVRAHLGLSRVEMAARLNVPHSSLATWEKGSRSVKRREVELADLYQQVFGVDAQWLLTGQPIGESARTPVIADMPRFLAAKVGAPACDADLFPARTA